MRLQAFLARAGGAPSRRKAEALIEAGRVTVDGQTATLGRSVTGTERIAVDGNRVTPQAVFSYLALNKPANFSLMS